MSVMGCKATVGHTEPTAGVAGLLQLVMVVLDGVACPNAQLRVMNPHVKSALESRPAPSVPLQVQDLPAPAEGMLGGVSSFGLNGTIAHIVILMPTDWSGPNLERRLRKSLIIKIQMILHGLIWLALGEPYQFLNRIRFGLDPSTITKTREISSQVLRRIGVVFPC